jgi:hypothetical protein
MCAIERGVIIGRVRGYRVTYVYTNRILYNRILYHHILYNQLYNYILYTIPFLVRGVEEVRLQEVYQ